MNQDSTNHKISVITATIIGMNAMIGSGIFTVPATLASFVGPVGIFAYLFVIISVWCMAFSLARLAQLFPQEGSFYTYAKQWGGHVTGLIASFSYMIGLCIAMGLLCQTAGHYLHTIFPHYPSHYFGFFTLFCFIILNMFGIELSKIGQHILIACTLFPLVIVSAMCISKADINNILPLPSFTILDIFKATRVVIFGFFGFECIASLFNVVKNPQQNLSRAITYSIIIVSIIYVFFVISLLLATPLYYFTDPHTPISQTLHHIFPYHTWIIGIIHFTILSSILGTIHSMIWSSSELLFSLFKKISPSFGKKLNQKQSVGIIGISIFLTFYLISNISLFFSLTAIFLISAFILSMITLIQLKQKLLHSLITFIGLITALAILFFSCQNLVEEISKFF